MSADATNSMSELEQRILELNRKWEKSTRDKEGKLTRVATYGNARMQPLDERLCVLYLCGIPFSQLEFCEELLGALEAGAAKAGVRPTVIVQNNLEDRLDGWRGQHRSLTFVLEREDEVPRLLASASKVCAMGVLPGYLVLREGQRVLQLWKGIDERLAEGFRLSALTSRLLNTSEILLDSDADLPSVLDVCKLRGAYQGQVLSLGEGASSFAEAVCAQLLDGACADFSECDTSSDKKRILLLCTQRSDDYWRLCRRIAGGLDPDAYDITLLAPGMRWKQVPTLEQQLYVTPPQVRVVTREQTFACSADDYIKTQVALETYGLYEHFDEWFATLDPAVAALEVQRIAGPASFDTMLYIDEDSSFWCFVASGVKATTKRKLELSDFAERAGELEPRKNRFSFAMEVEADASLFDEVVFVDRDGYAAAQEVAPELPVGFCDLIVDTENSYPALVVDDKARFGGEAKYFVGLYKSEQMGLATLTDLPSEACKGNAYLVDAVDEACLACVKALDATEKDDAWEAFVLEPQPSAIAEDLEETYGQRVRLIGDTGFFGMYTAKRYLSYFKACIVPSKESRTLVRAVAEAHGLPVYVAGEKGLELAEKRAFSSVEEAGRYARGECEKLC